MALNYNPTMIWHGHSNLKDKEQVPVSNIITPDRVRTKKDVSCANIA